MEWKVIQETGDGLTITDGKRGIAYIEPAETPEETQRIAQGIAAMPELLQAAEALVLAYELAGDDGAGSIDWSDVDVAFDLSLAAIAKATNKK